ncbi:Adenylate cyclase [hydrothermal vent metagenome]|uniref:Adenylate cyclase n=1 Tax=hydrothermal vent metagenome TaxID=652676 RepID=A0A3B0ZQ06_9ZZZZ
MPTTASNVTPGLSPTQLLGLFSAVLIPCITAIFLTSASGTALILIIGATMVAGFFAWRLCHTRKQPDNPDPKSQVQALLAPTHEFIDRLNHSSNKTPAANESIHALEQELGLITKKVDWAQSHRDTFEATILISDLRGYTAISETYSPDETISLLNRYFEHMSEIIYRHNGTIDKLMGDSILALFGSYDGTEKDAADAVTCAAEMQIAMYKFNRENQQLSMPPLYMGIGINTGKVVASKLGSALYNEQTIIGADVNLAARIESHTVRGQILISDTTYQQIHDMTEVSEPMHVIVKGRREAIPMYELISITNPEHLKVPEREIRRSPRVDVDIPFTFHVCEGKIITSEQNTGRISNISTGGMLAYSDTRIDPYFFVRFALDFNILGIECNDIYGKILKVEKKKERYEMSIEFTIIDPQDRQSIQDLVNNTLAQAQNNKDNKL